MGRGSTVQPETPVLGCVGVDTPCAGARRRGRSDDGCSRLADMCSGGGCEAGPYVGKGSEWADRPCRAGDEKSIRPVRGQ